MYLGKMVEMADVDELYRNPRHPYTVALLSAIPNPSPRIKKKRLVLKGDIPSPAAPPSGCRFHTRCWLRERLGNPERCSTEEPAFRDLGLRHQVACHYAEEMNTVGGEVKAAIGLDIAEPGAAAIPAASEPAVHDPSKVAPA
jgi:oligopeptide/dipeptide ABC transporter ATP-binding protein